MEHFDTLFDAAEKGAFQRIDVNASELVIFYRTAGDRYDFLLKHRNRRNALETAEIFKARSMKEILLVLATYRPDLADSEDLEILLTPSRENISRHPFVQVAIASGNVKLEKEIRIFYRLASPEDCAVYEELTGHRILPPLSEAYGRDYVIKSDTMTADDRALLCRSGYEIRHLPYFADAGYTHSKTRLNPHSKIGHDTAKSDAFAISFAEFLDLYKKP